MKKSYLFSLIFCLSFIGELPIAKAIYTIDTGAVVSCISDSNEADQSICEDSGPSGSKCEILDSSEQEDTRIALCMRPNKGITYCRDDSDCHDLDKPTCVEKIGSYTTMEVYKKNNDGEIDDDAVGVCSSVGGSIEKNSISQAVCNFIKIITGSAGRTVLGAVSIFIGVLFFIGKVNWSLLIAVLLGVGAVFGAPTLVKILTGKEFSCK